VTTVTASAADALAELARRWGDTGEAVRELALSALIHPSWSEYPAAAAGAWADYRDALLNADGLETGEICWQQYEPDLNGPDRQETAWLDACGQVDEALSVLLRGPRSTP